MKEGYPIVLTADIALMSEYTVTGFASAIPVDFLRGKIADFLFPTKSVEGGPVEVEAAGRGNIQKYGGAP